MAQKLLAVGYDIDDVFAEVMSALGYSYGCDSSKEWLACQSLLIEWGFDPDEVADYFDEIGFQPYLKKIKKN